MNKVPLVSACIITFNHKGYIRECLEHAVQQKTNFAYEVVVGDDCSTDGTAEICQEFATRYPDLIRYQPRPKNLGLIGNWKATIEDCRGSYVAICEGDDYWSDPLKLEKQVTFLEGHPEFSASFHDVSVIDLEGRTLKESKNSFLHNHDLSQEEMVSGRVMSAASLCFRNVIRDFPEEFLKSPTADNFLSSLLGNYGRGKFQSDIIPSAYRMHTGGVWSLKDNTQKKMTLLYSYFLMWQYYQRIGKPEWSKLLYRKIMLEGFYSNPYQDKSSGFLGTAEVYVVRQVRRLFRLLRKFTTSSPRPVEGRD